MSEKEQDLPEEDLAELERAYQLLEYPSFAARLSSLIGDPIEQALHLMPKSWYRKIDEAAERSISGMLDLTINGMTQISPDASNDPLHRVLVMGTGAVGGFFGPALLLAELPVTTALMLRSIADIAHSQGEDMSSDDAKLACIQVFAFGGRTKEDNAAETGYYGLRVTLGLHFSHRLVQFKTPSKAPIPAGINLVRAIASRFGVIVSDKIAAQMVPFAGAVSGALLNLVFMKHFQDMAKGHFIVRRLERMYGAEAIRQAYENIGQNTAKPKPSFSQLEGW